MKNFSMIFRRRASSTTTVDPATRSMSLDELEQSGQDVEYTALRMSKRWTADLSGLTTSSQQRRRSSRRISAAIAPNQIIPPVPEEPQPQTHFRNKRKSSIFVQTTETIIVTSIFDKQGEDARHTRVSSCSSERRRSSRMSGMFKFWAPVGERQTC